MRIENIPTRGSVFLYFDNIERKTMWKNSIFRVSYAKCHKDINCESFGAKFSYFWFFPACGLGANASSDNNFDFANECDSEYFCQIIVRIYF